MAFPQTAAPTVSIFNSAVTSHPVLMPPVVAAGDLLLVFGVNGAGQVFTHPAGWTNLHETLNTFRLVSFYKIANGTEDGTTVDFVSASNNRSVFQTYRVTAWHGTTPPEIGTAATGGSVSPNPPLLTPSWGAADTLWFTIGGTGPGTTVFSAYPTSYLNGVNTVSVGTQSGSVATARRELNATSDDPAVFTIAPSAGWIAQTLAIRPAADVPPPPPPAPSTGGNRMGGTGAIRRPPRFPRN